MRVRRGVRSEGEEGVRSEGEEGSEEGELNWRQTDCYIVHSLVK